MFAYISSSLCKFTFPPSRAPHAQYPRKRTPHSVPRLQSAQAPRGNSRALAFLLPAHPQTRPAWSG